MEKNSLIYWYPKVKNTRVPTPETEIVILKNQHSELMPICDGDFSPIQDQWEEILTSARKIGFPLFMRTDEFSGKHQWKKTCFVQKEEDLKEHIKNLLEDSFMADLMGLPIRALVFRKYIPMQNLFKAFYGEMPVNPEIRFFIRDGEILCWHWYWVEEAIERGSPKNLLPFNWKDIINNAKRDYLSGNDLMWLENDVRKIAKEFDGFWSVDFCLSAKREWIMIDMAVGERSWHPEDCKLNQKVLSNQSPTPHTLASPTFPTEKAINISLKESSSEDSQISSNDETSLNNNIIMFNKKFQRINGIH